MIVNSSQLIGINSLLNNSLSDGIELFTLAATREGCEAGI
jgi:hypothetical protein